MNYNKYKNEIYIIPFLSQDNIMKCTREYWIHIAVIVSSIIIILGFGFAEVGIYVNGINAKTTSGPSPFINAKYENITNFQLQKSIFSLWNWKYTDSIGIHSVILQQACPSIEHDILMFVDGNLAIRSNGKIVSTTSEIDIYDNQNNQLYTITTGSFWLTLLNLNTIEVAFQLRNSTGDTILYVASTNLFTIMTTYSFSDMNGVEIAYAEKDITTFPWTWKVNILHPESPVLDVRVLSLIFAHASFSEGGTDSNGKHVNTTDVCNNFFFYNGIVWGIVVGLFLIFLILIFWVYVKQCLLMCYHGDYILCGGTRRNEIIPAISC